MSSQFKLITSNSIDLFEERLNDFSASLAPDDTIVDIQFSTAALASSVEYTALVQVKTTAAWNAS